MFKSEIITDRNKLEVRFQQLLEVIYSEQELSLKSSKPYQESNLSTSIAVYRNDLICALASVFVNSEIENQTLALIGNFEAIDNLDAVELLMRTIEEECKKENISVILGPMNGSTWESYRLPLPSNNPLFFTEDVYPDYYPRLFSETGFDITEKYVSNKQLIVLPSAEQNEWLKSVKEKNGLTFSLISKEDYLSELPRIYEFCSLCFAGNTLYSPISKEEFIAKYSQLEKVIHPMSVMLVENSEKTIIGLLLCIPNYYSKNELVVKTMAVHPAFRSKGVASAIGTELVNLATKYEFEFLIHAFMHENNHSKNVSEKYRGECIREYILFRKLL